MDEGVRELVRDWLIRAGHEAHRLFATSAETRLIKSPPTGCKGFADVL